MTSPGKNIANRNNTIEVRIASSYKISEFNVSDLPDRVYELCKNLQLLELEYLVPHTVNEGKFWLHTCLWRNIHYLTLDGIEIVESKRYDSFLGKRNKRSSNYDRTQVYDTLECPVRYCEAEDLSTFCSPSQSCPSTPNLPNCWFKMGVRSVTTQQYKHYLNFQIACMPVCSFSSLDSRMPALEDVSSVGAMCKWYNTHGRCPHFK